MAIFLIFFIHIYSPWQGDNDKFRLEMVNSPGEVDAWESRGRTVYRGRCNRCRWAGRTHPHIPGTRCPTVRWQPDPCQDACARTPCPVHGPACVQPPAPGKQKLLVIYFNYINLGSVTVAINFVTNQDNLQQVCLLIGAEGFFCDSKELQKGSVSSL